MQNRGQRASWVQFVGRSLVVAALAVSSPNGGAQVLRGGPVGVDTAQSAAPDFERSSAGPWAKGRLLVAPSDDASDADFTKALKAHGAKSAGMLPGLKVHVVALPAQAAGNEEAVAAALARNPHIEFAEVDRLIEPGATVNDPSFPSEWHLTKVSAPTAWNTSFGSGVTIAILDTGVDGTHPDLAAQLVPGWNFYNNNSDTSDVNGHGTAVAGAAAAATNNGTGVAAVAGGARIMPVRIADPNAYAYWSTVAQGMTWAVDHGARVENISYIGASASSTIQNAASYVRSKGGVVFVCAGNSGTVDNTAPTSLITVVSATDEYDQLASFSTYGSFVDIAAPGHNILTTARGGGYQYWWGTSLATPIVAATAALIVSKRPDFTPSQIDSTLRSSATDLGPVGADIYFGAGRVNSAAAVQQAVSAPLSSADTTKPTVSIASPVSGSTVSGTVSVSANASDNIGVTKVEFRINGALVVTDTSAPYQFSWDTTKYAGSVTLTAVAYDAAGNSATSAGVTVTVSNSTTLTSSTDTTAPTLTITNPIAGSKDAGSVTITTTASDNLGTAGITQLLYIDGALKGTYAGTLLSYKWNVRKSPKGTHLISVTARDKAGNSATKSVQVTS